MNSQNKIELPAGYLSPSQLQLWESNPKEYIRTYIYGEQGFVNEAMRFGSFVSKCIEQGSSNDPAVDVIVKVIPRHSSPEHKMGVDFDGIRLYGIMDSFCPETKNFIENKTAMSPWTQEKVNSLAQIHFYAFMIWLEYKIVPEAMFTWLETKRSESIGLTGGFITFDVKFSLTDMLKMGARIKRVAREISEAYKIELKKLEATKNDKPSKD